MTKLIAVALGGAIGSIGRYTIAVGIEKLCRTPFPLETLTANLIGCLLIGLCWGWFERLSISNEFRLFLFTGVLGGFTTFSSFARETIQLFKNGEPLSAVFYILISNVFGLTLVTVGFFVSYHLIKTMKG